MYNVDPLQSQSTLNMSERLKIKEILSIFCHFKPYGPGHRISARATGFFFFRSVAGFQVDGPPRKKTSFEPWLTVFIINPLKIVSTFVNSCSAQVYHITLFTHRTMPREVLTRSYNFSRHRTMFQPKTASYGRRTATVRSPQDYPCK